MAFAQEQAVGQNCTAQDAISSSLHDKVLSGEVVTPRSSIDIADEDKKSDVSDGWKQSSFAKDDKVLVEITSSYNDYDHYWTLEELESLDPDIVIIRDYDSNAKWELDADWYISKRQTLAFKEGSLSRVKVSCIEPGALGDGFDSVSIYVLDDSGKRPRLNNRLINPFDSAWFDDDDDSYIGGDAGKLVIGSDVESLPDFWAAHALRKYKKVVFEKGSRLSSLGNACGYGDAGILEEIEGLPSSAKLDDHALGIPSLKKVTDENGKSFKAPESAWTWQYGEYSKEYGALSPAAPNYWKQQLKKVKGISCSVKAKKGGKSTFAKIYDVTYKKSKVTVLKGSKYKKAAKSQAKKIAVSKAGKVTVKKGLKKGTYKVSVKAACKGHYKTVTATVKVK